MHNNFAISLAAALTLMVCEQSCERLPTSNEPKSSNTARTESGQRGPAEPQERTVAADYSVLASNLADPLMKERDEKQAKKELAQLMAEARVKIVRYQSLQSHDPMISAIAKEAAESGAAMVQIKEGIASMEQQDPFADLATIGIGWYVGKPDIIAGGAADLLAKGDARQQERIKWGAAFNRSRSAQLMLPESAKKCAGPAVTAGSLLAIDFDESFAGSADHDSIKVTNTSGRLLTNCTVLIELHGKDAEVRQNVHFVPSWEAGGDRFANYGIGIQSSGTVYGRQTVHGVEEIRLSVWSTEAHQEEIAYVYRGAERDKDIRALLDGKMKVAYAYEAHPFFGDGPMVTVVLKGVPQIPPHALSLTFVPKKGAAKAAPVTLEWNQEQWNAEEERKLSLGDRLKFDPETLRIKVKIPDSSYEYLREVVIVK